MSEPSALQARFEAVDRVLQDHRPFWEQAPFKHARLPWEADWPELSRGLSELSEPALVELEEQPPRARRFLARWLPRLVDRVARAEPSRLEGRLALDDQHKQGVPARKWQQIEAFAARLPSVDLPILEWCSGKGHLARVLSHLTGQPARCVERDERLAHAGRRIAEERELPVDFSVIDALTEAAARELQPRQLGCALHACGQLHVRLIELAVARGTQALAISPCCYHFMPTAAVQPLSTRGRASRLRLDQHQCRLSLQETVTAAPSIQRRRQQLAAWRLGFDTLQRQLRGIDEYLPVPSAPPAATTPTFADFVLWAAERKQLALPAKLSLETFEIAGAQRLARVRRLNVLRHLFRRPIEMWLVLDRALYLEENGYQVDVGTFCERRVTPRNLLIRATRIES